MIQKLLILSIITTSALAQTSMLVCTLTLINDICTCNFLIFNPQGLNNLTIVSNPTPNCTLEDVKYAVGMGSSPNIPSAICNELPSIERLVMENIGIRHLNGMPFRNCVNLKTLLLGNNEIEVVPAYAFSMTNLERIELNDNKLKVLAEHSFDNLYNLKTLNLNGNSNGLTLPPVNFGQLANLQNLLASGCGLTELNPLWFSSLSGLVIIDLSRNNFTTIPSSTFSSQQNLRFLNLSNGQLAILPELLFQNTPNLLILDLKNNKIQELHQNLFENLQMLQNLYLSDNVNVSIPSNVFRSQHSIRSLDLASNNIATIDGSWFTSMKNLVNIDLSNNRNISLIPENTFKAVKGLESINLSGNRINKLDSRSFGSLHALTVLDVNGNLINEVDHYLISQAQQLTNVDFSGNQCTQIKTATFNESRGLNMNAMRGCFDTFDANPIELTTFNSTDYNWYSIRSNDGWDALKISVKAYENVHIVLSDSINLKVPPIEIRIGENRNRESFILDQGVAVYIDRTRNRLSEITSREFIIGWRFGIVMVFRLGDQLPFMAYSLNDRFEVNFFGLRTVINDSDHEAEWTVSRLKISA